ncbi:hypothetical protein T265_09316 [Opisthorchis viverrini]|uniref:Endonuclease/exonuclease/phosphatase domain-containing protein n=2 Tax=Opisthorchis viverrini TaxID=6198 RepID=A0A074ZHG0_OPIVI|nr:hypothetical protein T265_09316 [Opisthorchis viverrini]KER22655.1 hypothetical protein T265_09316 [Opisthorchis viverrini]
MSVFRMLCCIPLAYGQSEAKRSNLRTLREILLYLDEADEEQQRDINLFIYQLLTQLAATESTGRASDSVRSPFNAPLIDRHALSAFREAVKRLVSHPPTRATDQPTDQAHSLSSSSPTRTNDFADTLPPWTSVKSDSVFRHNIIIEMLSRCPLALLELLFQMESVKSWNELLAASNLTNYVALELPTPCTSSYGGQVRIASWNLNRFTLAKARHPGFREVLCLTILRSKISLMVLQEVASVDVADVLCAELNSPTLPHVRKWAHDHPPWCVPKWKVASSTQAVGSMFAGREYALFLYNENAGVCISRTSLMEPPTVAKSLKVFSRSPCPALCKIRSARLILVSVHLKARGLRNSRIGRTAAEVQALETVVQAFYDTQSPQSHLVILGDFNLNPEHEAFSRLRERGFQSVLNGYQATTPQSNLKDQSDSPSSTLCPTAYDNAWISPSLISVDTTDSSYTGNSGVITSGLRHPLIPGDIGAGANGFISDHCPIWFDLRFS